MKARSQSSLFCAILLVTTTLSIGASAQEKPGNKPTQSAVWKQVDDILGRKGEQESPGVWKYDVTRDDLHVKLKGAEIKPELALDGWITFQQSEGPARMMGELVLTPDEIDGVISKLQAGGIREMALHNHLAGESPEVMYLHIQGPGEPVVLAQALKSALAETKTPVHEEKGKEKVEGLDVQRIHSIVGGDQESGGGVLSLEVKRRERISEGGRPIPPAMEVASEVKFQPTGNGQALMYGEMVLVAAEVNPVLKSLRQNGISMMALHNHMLDEQPRIFFVHYLVQGDAIKLAQAARAALDLTNSEKAGSK